MNFGVASAQPVRTPGPTILENEPLDMAFPKLSAEGVGERVRSMSTRRGTGAVFAVEERVEVVDVGHWRKS